MGIKDFVCLEKKMKVFELLYWVGGFLQSSVMKLRDVLY